MVFQSGAARCLLHTEKSLAALSTVMIHQTTVMMTMTTATMTDGVTGCHQGIEQWQVAQIMMTVMMIMMSTIPVGVAKSLQRSVVQLGAVAIMVKEIEKTGVTKDIEATATH